MKSKKFTERLFLAIEFPRFAREQILEKRKKWRKQLEDDVRWVPALNLHLTLRYFGEIETSKSKQFCSKLEAICQKIEPFQLAVDKVGCSPSFTEARTIWLGFEESDTLLRLLKEVEEQSRLLQLPKDKLPFSPRVVLSKNSEPQHVPPLHIKPDLKGFMVRNLSLIESRMAQNGPTYHPLRKFELLGKS